MAQQNLNYGSAANDGTGDGLRDTFIKVEDNFTELYDRPVGSETGEYRASSTTTPTPTSGQIRWNNATQANATQIFLSDTTNPGTDLTNYLGTIQAGSIFYVQDKGNAANYSRWQIASIVDSGTYFTLGVTLLDAGTNIGNNTICAVSITSTGVLSAETLLPVYASCGMTANATATTISVTGTYYPISGTISAGNVSSNMTTDAAGKITYTGSDSRHFHIVSNFDMTTASNSQITSFRWYKNGVAISRPVERKVGTGSDIGAASLHADAMLTTNDYLELKVTNLSSASTITVKNLYLFVMGMIMA